MAFERRTALNQRRLSSDLDSQSGERRSSVKRVIGITPAAGVLLPYQTPAMIRDHSDGLACLRLRDPAAEVLANEGCVAETHDIAGVHRCHAQESGGPSLVVASSYCWTLRVTPDSAQQRGIRRCCHCQDDPRDRCSKHECLNTTSGKDGAKSHIT